MKWLAADYNSSFKSHRPANKGLLRSCISSHRLRCKPPAKPVNDPFEPITRWHGTMINKGFLDNAIPTALEAPCLFTFRAMASYVAVLPQTILANAALISVWKLVGDGTKGK